MTTKVQEKKIQFKPYDQNQVLEVPVVLGALIPSSDLVRVVDIMVEGLDQSKLEFFYSRGGRPAYHPKLMLKVWLYGYCQGIYTSRRLSKAIRSNINFIWLSGNSQPCFKTLSSFRSGRMEKMIDEVFSMMLLSLVQADYINVDDLYVDGSTWRANANAHKVVWRKNTERHKGNALERINAFFAEIKKLQESEDREYGEKDLEELGEGKELVLTSKDIEANLAVINKLVEEESSKELKKKLKPIVTKINNENEKVKKYEAQEGILGSRNSYSKTDPDASAMYLKDERLRPAYNVVHTTNNQFVVNYTISQNASDCHSYGNASE